MSALNDDSANERLEEARVVSHRARRSIIRKVAKKIGSRRIPNRNKVAKAAKRMANKAKRLTPAEVKKFNSRCRQGIALCRATADRRGDNVIIIYIPVLCPVVLTYL
jgi:hypothetical protein